jgi:Glycosyl transferase family 2
LLKTREIADGQDGKRPIAVGPVVFTRDQSKPCAMTLALGASYENPVPGSGGRGSVPLVGIAVLHWGSREATAACLESLRKATYTAVRIFLVDNARSLDRTIAQRTTTLAIEILRPPGNLGFAEGGDLGIAAALEAGTEYIFLLNNDAVVSRHCLEILVSVVRGTPRAGILLPQIAFQEVADTMHSRNNMPEFQLMIATVLVMSILCAEAHLDGNVDCVFDEIARGAA